MDIFLSVRMISGDVSFIFHFSSRIFALSSHPQTLTFQLRLNLTIPYIGLISFSV